MATLGERIDEAKKLRHTDVEHCLYCLRQIIDEATNSNDIESTVKAYIALGNAEVTVGDYKSAMRTYNQARDLIPEPKAPTHLWHVYNGIAIIYSHIGRLADSSQHYKEAITYADQAGEPKSRAVLLINLGNIYVKQERVDDAIRNFRQANEIARDLNDSTLTVISLINLGKCYSTNEYLVDAINALEDAKALAESDGLNLYLPPVLYEKGRIYRKMDKLDAAVQDQTAAINLAESLKDQAQAIYALLSRSECYEDKQAHELAEGDLSKAIELADELENTAAQQEAYKQAWRYHKSRNNWEAALKDYEKFHHLTKLLQDNESLEQLNFINFESLQKSHERTKIINVIGKKLTSELDLEKLLQLMASQFNEVIDTSAFGIGQIAENKKELVFDYFIRDQERVSPKTINIECGKSLGAWAVQNNRNIIIQDFQTDISSFNLSIEDLFETETCHLNLGSGLYTPLVVANDVIGVMAVQSPQKNAYTLEAIDTFFSLAPFVAIAVKNAQQASLIRAQADTAKAAAKAKSAFLAHMSHEIRTPLNGILGMAELLRTNNLQQTELSYINVIESSGNALLSILNDILDFSKIESGKMEIDATPFDLDKLIQECTSIFYARTIDSDVKIIIHITPDVPTHIKGDPVRLKQILINLLGNALKFTQKGQIIIRIDRISNSETIQELKFSVQDTGIGISKTGQENIFRSFSQADSSTTRKYGGTGLGLAICKQLAQLMGGAIGVESKEGKGSNFWFTIQCEVPSAEEIHDEVRPQIDQFSGLRLLLAESHEYCATVIDELAQAWNMSLNTVVDGITAKRTIEGTSTSFDIAILNFSFPDYDGLELARIIRGSPNGKKTSIILISDFNNPQGITERISTAKRTNLINELINPPISRNILHKSLDALLNSQMQTKTVADQVLETKGCHKDLSYLTVLVAEDNTVNQLVTKGMLMKYGINPLMAENGKEAVDIVEQSNTPIDLILMDCEMPEMDGYEATRKIRLLNNGHTGMCLIVGLSANALAEQVEKAISSGMDEYIRKPFSFNEISAPLFKADARKRVR